MTAANDVAERDRLAEEARARLGISEFHVTGSLRSAWYEAQRRDGSLAGILRKTEHPFVLGGDGKERFSWQLDVLFELLLSRTAWPELMV